MKDAGKEVSSEELLIVFEMLRDNGHLDYETHGVDSSLTSYELDRYSRNLNYFSWVDVSGVSQHVTQKRLLDSSVLILGAGGIGSAIACSLAAMGIGKIRVIDFDVVELSNLNRQIAYSEADIGRFKIDALSDRILQINSKCNLSTRFLALRQLTILMHYLMVAKT